MQYSGDTISFTVKAVDRGKQPKEGKTRVEFKITDNAQNPYWLNETGTTILVSENQTLNTPFAYFVAKSNFSDPDVSYFLMSGSTPVKIFENFKIRETNRVMALLLYKPLDYESKKTYNLRARVTVSRLFSFSCACVYVACTAWLKFLLSFQNRYYPEPLTSDLRFTINVTDANDRVPIFKKFDLNSGIFYASVYENELVNTTVIKIIVEDKDPTENFHKVSHQDLVGMSENLTMF